MSKVISGFKCRHTGKIYHVGETYDGEKVKGKKEAFTAEAELDAAADGPENKEE